MKVILYCSLISLCPLQGMSVSTCTVNIFFLLLIFQWKSLTWSNLLNICTSIILDSMFPLSLGELNSTNLTAEYLLLVLNFVLLDSLITLTI